MSDKSARKPIFRPQVFQARSISDAMRIVVTREEGTTTDERWRKETPYLVEDSGKHLGIGPESCVLDYGCGIGRLAKGLIERFGCRVVGVDFSPSMRLLAPEYVLSERFTVWPPEVLETMIGKGFRTTRLFVFGSYSMLLARTKSFNGSPGHCAGRPLLRTEPENTLCANRCWLGE